MWVRGFIAAVFILCSPFTFQVVGCPRLTTWSGYSSHLWRSLKLWVYNWLRPLYYFLFIGIGFYWILLFSPAPLQKNINTFLFLTTWLKVCNLPNYNNLHDFFSAFLIVVVCRNVFHLVLLTWRFGVQFTESRGIQTFSFSDARNKTANIFPLFDDAFHISYFFPGQHFDTHPGP